MALSNQNLLLAVGAGTALVSKFILKKDWKMAGLFGMAAIALVAVIKARNSTDNPAV
jgi:hypothetical protein